jgi:hypothetical protein
MGISEVLTERAGVDPLQDRYHCGYIAAFMDLLKAEPEFTEESE